MTLTYQQQSLLDTGAVLMVGKKSDEIPASERQGILRGFGSNFGSVGLGCTLLREDGVVLIVTDGPIEDSTLRHEFIHAAQCFADADIMEETLAAARRIGQAIIAEILRAVDVRQGDVDTCHRDYFKAKTTWEIAKSNEDKPLSPNIVIFDMLRDFYPTKETQELAAELGFTDREGVYAAMAASIIHDAGIRVDPQSDLAREIVAYTFQALEADVIDNLFEAAIKAQTRFEP